MSPQKIDEYWRQRVHVIMESDPKLSAPAVGVKLGQEAAQLGRADNPSDRWIRIEQINWRNRPDAERRPYREFLWPESMVTADLPWEASAVALELLREHHKMKLRRPVLALVQWFWRATLAAPGLPFEKRYRAATLLHASEIAQTDISWRRVEAHIASGEMPESWFGEELGQNLGVSITWDRASDILRAVNPMLTPEGASSIVDLLRWRHEGGPAPKGLEEAQDDSQR